MSLDRALLAAVLVTAIAVAGVRWLEPRVAPPDTADPALVHRVDLNAADAGEIAALPGIGDVLAGRIVDDRARRGRFSRIEDLARVHGIGPRTVARIRRHTRCDTEEP